MDHIRDDAYIHVLHGWVRRMSIPGRTLPTSEGFASVSTFEESSLRAGKFQELFSGDVPIPLIASGDQPGGGSLLWDFKVPDGHTFYRRWGEYTSFGDYPAVIRIYRRRKGQTEFTFIRKVVLKPVDMVSSEVWTKYEAGDELKAVLAVHSGATLTAGGGTATGYLLYIDLAWPD